MKLTKRSAAQIESPSDAGPCAELPLWLRANSVGHTELFLAVQPHAKSTEIVGEHGGLLKIRVSSPPVDGAANAALTAFLAQKLGVKERDVTLVRGATGRKKTFLVHGLAPHLVYFYLTR